MLLFKKMHHLIGGILLVSGTSIGIGMLALPVATAEGGFFPAISIYIISWLFMVAIGLLVVEACLWCPNDANLITISHKLLGKKGAALCWLLYLFLLYCLMVAHTAIGGSALSQAFPSLSHPLASTIYIFLFGCTVYFGTLWVDRINKVLISGVIITFFLFIFGSIEHVKGSQLLSPMDWKGIWLALPIIFTAFGFQILIPTLMTYMKRDVPKVKLAIWIGTSIPLILYLVWELIIIGIVPLPLLIDAKANGQNAVAPLEIALQRGSISWIGQLFAFFSMTTSFIGLGIAFFDFWADGLKWKKKGLNKIWLFSLVFIIPLLIVFIDPTIFLKALNLAGSIGVSLLIGVLPILFIWAGRYVHKLPTTHQFVGGGKSMLIVLLLFSLLTIVLGL